MARQKYSMRLMDKYFRAIKEGSKSVEGRIDKGIYAQIQQGDLIEFHSDATPNPITRQVQRVSRYGSFKKMLEDVGVDKCLPGIKSVEEGEKIYHGFPNYKKKAEERGVLALFLENVCR